MIRDARSRAVLYDVFLADLQVARQKELITDKQWADLKKACVYQRQLLNHRTEYASAGLARKVRILFSLWRARVDGPLIQWMLVRLMPAPLFRSLKVTVNSARLGLKTGFRNGSVGGSAR